MIRGILKPPWRTIVPCAGLLLILCLGYLHWSPGLEITDGRFDRNQNGIWIQHGWLGDDDWFARNSRQTSKFRNPERINELASLLGKHHIRDLFCHLCPCDDTGQIAKVHPEQTELFLKAFQGFRVMPWVGGVLGNQVHPENEKWRQRFIESISDLLKNHPHFAGVHINIEPWPSGNRELLLLLDELKKSLPEGKMLSVAAYPPPTFWQRSSDVHWDEAYYREVAKRVDQMVVMMYDTSITRVKVYQNLMADWTEEAVEWSAPASVLLGIPTYEDRDTGYHDPGVENPKNAILGINAGANRVLRHAKNYQGMAIYSEWETDAEEWKQIEKLFLNRVSERPGTQ